MRVGEYKKISTNGGSWQTARVAAKKSKQVTRSLAAAASVGLPGLTVEQNLKFAGVIQSEVNAKERQEDTKAFLLSKALDDLRQETKQAFEFAKLVCPVFDKTAEVWKDFSASSAECRHKRDQIVNLEKGRKEKSLNTHVKSFMSSFLDHHDDGSNSITTTPAVTSSGEDDSESDIGATTSPF